jgi:hypothetical protein
MRFQVIDGCPCLCVGRPAADFDSLFRWVAGRCAEIVLVCAASQLVDNGTAQEAATSWL